jgi:hypothetical protein
MTVFGSGIRDPVSGMGKNQDPGYVNIRIRDKHPGSATMLSDGLSVWRICLLFITDSFGSKFESDSSTRVVVDWLGSSVAEP